MTHTIEPPRLADDTTVTSTTDRARRTQRPAARPGHPARRPAWDQTRLRVQPRRGPGAHRGRDGRRRGGRVATVRWANRFGATVTAQPVGHGATRATDGAVLLRTRELRDITVDPQRRVARVGAGAKWGRCSPRPRCTASPGWPAAPLTRPSPASRSAAGSAGSAAPTAWPRTASSASTSSTRPAIVAGSPRRATRPVLGDPGRRRRLRHRGRARDRAAPGAAPLRRAADLADRDARPVLRTFAKVTRRRRTKLTLWTHLLQFPPLPMVPEPIRGKSFVAIGRPTSGDR